MTLPAQPNLVVTAANGDLGEAVFKTLRSVFPVSQILGVESGEQLPARLYFSEIERVPRGDDKEYPSALFEVSERFGADFIIPCSDNEVIGLAEKKIRDASPCPILMPQNHLVNIFGDKWVTYHWLSDNGFPTPRTCLLEEAHILPMPMLAKPRLGSGSMGIYLVSSEKLLEGLLDQFGSSYIAQHYLGKSAIEYTCALLGNKGSLNYSIMRRRLDAGRTVQVELVDDARIKNIIDRFFQTTRLEGPLNLQMMESSEGPMIIEVNPRFSSTVNLRHLLGFRDLQWLVNSFFYAVNMPGFIPELEAKAYRVSREIVDSSKFANQPS